MSLDFIFQAAQKRHHKDEVNKLLTIESLEGAVLSAAFSNQSGVSLVQESLKNVGAKVSVYIGIRNDITSYQALKALIETGANVYAVDTGSRGLIFHPKIYAGWSDAEARAIVGSANLTFSGLTNNIEASLLAHLNLACGDDLSSLNAIREGIDSFRKKHSEHVFRLETEDKLKDLLLEGRIVDEARKNVFKGPKRTPNSDRDALGTIGTFKTPKLPKSIASSPKPIAVATSPMGHATTIKGYCLAWESKPLSERDLSIPTGANTNAAGSMLWKKANYEDIDQRHYFRDEVFAELDWMKDRNRNKEHIERCVGKFTLIVKGVNYGTFSLQLSHNTKTTTPAYRQNNAMTQIHWGEAKPVIAKKDLLGRLLSLYKSSDENPTYVIEID